MKFKIRKIKIKAGNYVVALMHIHDAIALNVYPGDRIELKRGKKSLVAIIDTTHEKKYVPPGVIGLFGESSDILSLRQGQLVEVSVVPKPRSVSCIKKKLDGKKLKKDEIREIIDDLISNKLSEVEVSYFVAACYQYGMTITETFHLTEAMYETGETLKPRSKNVFDKHCIGGIPANRTTPIVVSICAATGITIPKTSSRSITSPAGTADVMEVLCNVSIKLKRMKQIVDRIGACLVWGGALDLAPADDKIIAAERPLSIDAEAQLIASILAKKLSVGAKHILIDIPVADDAKVNKKAGKSLKNKFEKIGKMFGVNLKVVLTDGRQPIGRGIGPALEARDVLWVLENDPRSPKDLLNKSLALASIILEMAKKAKKGKGRALAEEILSSGKAHKKFIQILKAQGMKISKSDKVPMGKFTYHYVAKRSGHLYDVDNFLIAAISKAAGSPTDKSAGMYLYKHIGDHIKKGEILFTIYARNEDKLEYAKSRITQNPFIIKGEKREKAGILPLDCDTGLCKLPKNY